MPSSWRVASPESYTEESRPADPTPRDPQDLESSSQSLGSGERGREDKCELKV